MYYPNSSKKNQELEIHSHKSWPFTKFLISKVITIFVVLLICSTKGIGQDFEQQYNLFLEKYLDDGLVNYASINENPNELENLVKKIREINFRNLDINNQKAFLINAYNILMIHSVVQKYPVKSPLFIAGIFRKKVYEIDTISYSLNQIEKFLTNTLKETRAHFVLVCGAKGCPKLSPIAFTGDNIEQQLEGRSRVILNSDFIHFDHKKKKVKLSMIFLWYKKEFGNSKEELVTYINKFREHKIPHHYKVGYYNYDWSLNEQ